MMVWTIGYDGGPIGYDGMMFWTIGYYGEIIPQATRLPLVGPRRLLLLPIGASLYQLPLAIKYTIHNA